MEFEVIETNSKKVSKKDNKYSGTGRDIDFQNIKIRRNKNILIIDIEIPGVNEDDIEMNLKEDEIEVKAEKKIEKKVEYEGFFRDEKSYKSFYRKFGLPLKIYPKKESHLYKNGFLRVKAPIHK
jgi:HSP20 family protein